MATAAPAASTGLLDRAIRAARLDAAVYKEVEDDTTATTQAAIVVLVGAIAAGIGTGFTVAAAGTGAGFVGALVDVIAALVGWAAYAWVAYFLGTTILKGAQTHADWGQVARTLGFASAPRAFLLLGIVPGLFTLVAFVVAIWVLVTTVVAVRAALDISTGRAIVVAICSALALGLVQVLIASIV